jgi:hypothetical protein
MPAIMPPINPNIIAALGQYFGGMQNRTIRTPPFVKPGGMAQRGEVLGRPSMPTPGMPQVMPQPVGGPAPTAPGAAPSPRSLGDELSNIPRQPELTPTPQAAAPGAAPSAAPSASPLGTVPADAQEIYAPDLTPPGGKVVNKDGTTYVLDKEGRLIRKMEPQPYNPNAPAGGGQSPASMPQKKGGIWDRLTDPSLAGIALAAGQQMTRARYPGESGIGNAVNAVTAGYNTLAQQRQMQYAREQAAREQRMKEEKQAQDIAESKSRAEQNKAQAARYGKQTEHEVRQDELDKIKANDERTKNQVEEIYKNAKLNLEQKQAAAQALMYENQSRNLDLQYSLAERNAINAQKNYDENVRHHRSLEETDRARVDLERARVNLEGARIAKEKAVDFGEIQKQARQNVAAEDAILNNPNNPNRTKPMGPPATVQQRIAVETQRLLREQQEMKGSASGTAPTTQAAPAAAPAVDPSRDVLTTSLPPVQGEDTRTTNIGTMVLRQGKWLRYVPATQ